MRPSLLASATMAVACLASSSSAAIIASYSVGSGSSTSSVQIDFSNGNGYLFTVRWDEPMNGYQLLQYIDSQLETVSHTAQVFSFGAFVTGIGVGADTEYGEGDLWPIENYWHYWTQDPGAWEQAMVGASDRTIFNGSFDAWVFGSPVAPQAVPAPGALALLVLGLRSRRR
jgi:hypothetical protein